MVLWVVWLVVKGLIHGVRLPQRPPGGEGVPPAPTLRKIGAVLLVGVVGVLVSTAPATATLVTQRGSQPIPLRAKIVQAGARVQFYARGLARLERVWEANTIGTRATAQPLAGDAGQKLSTLWQRPAGWL